MTGRDESRLTESTFMGHGVFEARHFGEAALRSSLPPATFDVLLNCLVMGWLEAGYPLAAVTAAEQAALAAYRRGDVTAWGGGIKMPRKTELTKPDAK